MSHKVYLLSCAMRYSSKLQKKQSLENFVTMVIQGTQVPMYTNTYCFCVFLIFQIFLYFYKKQNKAKLKTNKQTNNMLNKAKYKTRLTQNRKVKQTSNA